ncbi:PREDICTED: uncharacterized protein LOC104764988 isoform X1 [Camelina sativa]|uniref:Uncharacterized protein LOC104764988 isoform X1 n=1 Tax=Camelina sativa TaxID=90675 RepID=A0ABM0XJK2_CAMSA|nr:PREDICTED: uncharacterized protein LOC104764988 isoform X1 [Camelina sativa]
MEVVELDFRCSDVGVWKEALSSYESRIESLNKPELVSLDQFYRNELPCLLHDRDPNPYLTTSELSQLMKWKLSRGKWRPRLLDFVSSLDDSVVKSASEKAFKSLPDISKAVKELTVLKGVGPATASAVLAAYAPDIAPFMSDEFYFWVNSNVEGKAMEVALGSSKDYSLKQYLLFVTKLHDKSKELKLKGEWDGPSDIERALWSCTVRAKSQPEKSSSGKKRKR